MTAVHGEDKRDLLPRWREFGDAVRSGELDSVTAEVEAPETTSGVGSTGLDEAAHAFATEPGIHTAGDLLTQAVLQRAHGNRVAHAAAEFVLESSGGKSLRDLAALFLSKNKSGDVSARGVEHVDRAYVIARMSQLRSILRREPRNAIRWTDLALAQLNLGSTQQAQRSMQAALGLQPANRFVLRSAVRLHIHLDQPDVAHHLLQRVPKSLEDPWIRAASLATASLVGTGLPSLRASRRILEASHFAPWHLSELAGQIATLELGAGDVRKARKSMRRALLDPTENTLAQAEWASHHGIPAPAPGELDAPLSFEARARAFSGAGDFRQAVDAALYWHNDQPFDPSPAVFLSYLASVALEDYELAERAARRGLVANPDLPLLRNNMVFALANQGKVDELVRNSTVSKGHQLPLKELTR